MYLSATDDFAHPDVVACMAKQPKFLPSRACTMKKKYKLKICTINVKNKFYEGTVGQCLQDPSFSGSTVSNNGL
jgi:hypothetical protein